MMTASSSSLTGRTESDEHDLAIARSLMSVYDHAIAMRDFSAAADVAEQLVEHTRRLRRSGSRAKHL